MDKHFLPECFTDTILIEQLVPSAISYNHKFGCNNVAKEMTTGRLKDKFAVGIIDKDKSEIKYLSEFEKIDSVESSLLLWKHSSKPHYIIQLCPALEKWLIEVCKKGKLSLEDFGLPLKLDELIRATKSTQSDQDVRISNLCKALAGRSDIVEIKKLRHWISYLKEKNYKADIKDLKNV